MKKQYILFGAGDEGRKLLSSLNPDKVFCFADNDPAKVGTIIDGKKVISFDELLSIHRKYTIVISVSKRYAKYVKLQLIKHRIFATKKLWMPINYKVEQLKNKYRGQRCFIVCPGPSLRFEDLDKLHDYNEICFSCNKIYKAFNKTNWRPKFYVAIDPFLLLKEIENLVSLNIENLFIRRNFYSNDCLRRLKEYRPENFDTSILDKENVFLLSCRLSSWDYTKIPKFSKDPSQFIYSSGTVTFAMLQLAFYMGFKKIYIIGADNDFSDVMKGNDKNHYFIKDYYKKGENNSYLYDEESIKSIIIRSEKSFISVKRHAYFTKTKVYNATRGGKLEIFRRVDFDTLFN